MADMDYQCGEDETFDLLFGMFQWMSEWTEDEYNENMRREAEAIEAGPEAEALWEKEKEAMYIRATQKVYPKKISLSDSAQEAMVMQTNDDLVVYETLNQNDPVVVANEILLQVGYVEPQTTNIMSAYDDEEVKHLWKNLLSGYSHEKIWLVLAPYNQVNNFDSDEFKVYSENSPIFMTRNEVLHACKEILKCDTDDVFYAFRLFINFIGNVGVNDLELTPLFMMKPLKTTYRYFDSSDGLEFNQSLIKNGKMIRNYNRIEITGIGAGLLIREIIGINANCDWVGVISKFVLDLRAFGFVSKAWYAAACIEARRRFDDKSGLLTEFILPTPFNFVYAPRNIRDTGYDPRTVTVRSRKSRDKYTRCVVKQRGAYYHMQDNMRWIVSMDRHSDGHEVEIKKDITQSMSCVFILLRLPTQMTIPLMLVKNEMISHTLLDYNLDIDPEFLHPLVKTYDNENDPGLMYRREDDNSI